MLDSITKACSITKLMTYTHSGIKAFLVRTWIGDGFENPALLIAFKISAIAQTHNHSQSWQIKDQCFA